MDVMIYADKELMDAIKCTTGSLLFDNEIKRLEFYQGEDRRLADDWRENVTEVSEIHVASFHGDMEKLCHCATNEINSPISGGPKLIADDKMCEKSFTGYFLGTTPLMIASSQGHIQTAKYLLKHGASVNDTDSLGLSAFSLACANNKLKICKFLLSKGAGINLKDYKFRMTPLLLSCRQNHLKIARWLIRNGCAINVRDIYGRSEIHYAAWNYNIRLMRYLVSKGSDVNCTDNTGATPLHLLLAGSDDEPNENSSLEQTTAINQISDYVSGDKIVEIDIKRHIRRGCGIEGEEWFSLMTLLSLGADIEAKDNTGRTPLHIVTNMLLPITISRGYVIVERPAENQCILVQMLLLLNSGADPATNDWFGFSAMDACRDKNNWVGVKLMSNYMKKQTIRVECWDYLTNHINEHGWKYTIDQNTLLDDIEYITDIVLQTFEHPYCEKQYCWDPVASFRRFKEYWFSK